MLAVSGTTGIHEAPRRRRQERRADRSRCGRLSLGGLRLKRVRHCAWMSGCPLSFGKLSLDPSSQQSEPSNVRQFLAAVLLCCVGFLIPASASPVRICLLEFGLNSAQADSKCCSDCNRETTEPDPCCVDLHELPDSGAPQLPVELPPAIITDVPAALPPMIHAVTWMCREHPVVSAPIRGPTSPAAYRAVLGIWRL
jgi:hypothetical protein